MRWKLLASMLATTAVAVAVTSYFLSLSFDIVRGVSISEIASDPQSFDRAHVWLHGYIVDTKVYMFGPKYVLRNFDDKVEIALNGKSGAQNVDLDLYVSFVFDGRNYTKVRNLRVNVSGHVRYIGPVTDAPSFHLDVERIEPNVTDLKTIVIEFLRTTDVSNSVWDGIVEILEVYDHEFGGKVVVVKYVTMNAVHPHFMCEAIEEHVAVITLNRRGKVASAFCIWGSFHGQDKIWDLINRRWIHN